MAKKGKQGSTTKQSTYLIISRVNYPVYLKLTDGNSTIVPPRGKLKLSQGTDVQGTLPAGVIKVEIK